VGKTSFIIGLGGGHALDVLGSIPCNAGVQWIFFFFSSSLLDIPFTVLGYLSDLIVAANLT
jgi:hypothetical protein